MIGRLCCAAALCMFSPAFLQVARSQSRPEEANRAAAIVATAQTGAGSPDDAAEVIQVRARKLAGYVHMAIQKDNAVAKVLVEECDANWDRVLKSTTTDYQGYFALKPARGRKIHYLRLTAKGFSARYYAVTLSPDAPPELKLELRLASNSQKDPAGIPPGVSFAGRGMAVRGVS